MKVGLKIRNKEGSNKPTRYYSKKQEKQVAKELGGRTTKNSGATPFSKGDVFTDDYLVECKTKTSPSSQITIKKEWLEKLNAESLFMGKNGSVLVFDFGENTKKYCIIDLDTFKDLISEE